MARTMKAETLWKKAKQWCAVQGIPYTYCRAGHSLHLCWSAGHGAVLRVLRQPLVQRARYHLSPDPRYDAQ